MTTRMMTTTNSAVMSPRSHSRAFRIRAMAVVCLLLALATAGWAGQSKDPAKNPDAPYALIEGTVWDAHNQPFYGARVSIRLAGQKKAHWERISDHRGEFAQRVPAGRADYIVTAELPAEGGKSKKGKGPAAEVAVHVEAEERVDASLHLK